MYICNKHTLQVNKSDKMTKFAFLKITSLTRCVGAVPTKILTQYKGELGLFLVLKAYWLCSELILAKIPCTELDNFGTEVDWYRTRTPNMSKWSSIQ